MLKAFLLFRGQAPRRTHDLLALFHDCASYDGTLAGLEEDCRALNLYSTDVRYPEDLTGPCEVEGRAAIGRGTTSL